MKRTRTREGKRMTAVGRAGATSPETSEHCCAFIPTSHSALTKSFNGFLQLWGFVLVVYLSTPRSSWLSLNSCMARVWQAKSMPSWLMKSCAHEAQQTVSGTFMKTESSPPASGRLHWQSSHDDSSFRFDVSFASAFPFPFRFDVSFAFPFPFPLFTSALEEEDIEPAAEKMFGQRVINTAVPWVDVVITLDTEAVYQHRIAVVYKKKQRASHISLGSVVAVLLCMLKHPPGLLQAAVVAFLAAVCKKKKVMGCRFFRPRKAPLGMEMPAHSNVHVLRNSSM